MQPTNFSGVNEGHVCVHLLHGIDGYKESNKVSFKALLTADRLRFSRFSVKWAGHFWLMPSRLAARLRKIEGFIDKAIDNAKQLQSHAGQNGPIMWGLPKKFKGSFGSDLKASDSVQNTLIRSDLGCTASKFWFSSHRSQNARIVR